MLTRSLQLTKAVAQFPVRSYHGGVPGNNLPFPIKNRYVLTALFSIFFSSGLAVPFLMVRHQLLKIRDA